MNILAAFIFFTRLPFWRIREVPAECFKHVVPYWPLSGWLTGGVMAGVLWSAAQVLPFTVAVLLALTSRLLIRRRHQPGTYPLYYEGFAHRQLWGHRIDRILLPAMESPDKSSSLLRLLCTDCRRHCEQVDFITDH